MNKKTKAMYDGLSFCVRQFDRWAYKATPCSYLPTGLLRKGKPKVEGSQVGSFQTVLKLSNGCANKIVRSAHGSVDPAESHWRWIECVNFTAPFFCKEHPILWLSRKTNQRSFVTQGEAHIQQPVSGRRNRTPNSFPWSNGRCTPCSNAPHQDRRDFCKLLACRTKP